MHWINEWQHLFSNRFDQSNKNEHEEGVKKRTISWCELQCSLCMIYWFIKCIFVCVCVCMCVRVYLSWSQLASKVECVFGMRRAIKRKVYVISSLFLIIISSLEQFFFHHHLSIAILLRGIQTALMQTRWQKRQSIYLMEV